MTETVEIKHRAKRTGDGNYEYRGFDIQRDTWHGSSWSFYGFDGINGSTKALKAAKTRIDEILRSSHQHGSR